MKEKRPGELRGRGDQTVLRISFSGDAIAGGSPWAFKKKQNKTNRNYLQLFKGQAKQQDFLQKQTPTQPENYYEVI